jgi:hypothetical protein
VEESIESKNILDLIQELFGNLPGDFNILEEQIDINLQMEYYEFSKNVTKEEDDEVAELISILNQKAISDSCVKETLIKLASKESIEAFRAIEDFAKHARIELKAWSILALQESRMLIESKLLDVNKVFISTGLGGKAGKLRYFIVLVKKENRNLNKTQKKIILNEFEIILKKHDAELEEISFYENLTLLKAVVPLKVPIRELFREAVTECNFYGNFLNKKFIVTNVKELSIEEIKDFLNTWKENKEDDRS